MSALAEVLVEHQWSHNVACQCVCGDEFDTDADLVEHQAEMVAAAGLVVISAPKGAKVTVTHPDYSSCSGAVYGGDDE